MSSTHEQTSGGGAGMQPGQSVPGQQSQQAQPSVPRPAHAYHDRLGPSGTQYGFTMLAAILMILSGLWDFLAGLAAVIKGSYFIVLPNYAYNISVSGWGWFHLILGVVVFAAGVALFTDMTWARIVGAGLALISAVVNFLYIPYQPVWSIIVIAIDVFVIWALMTPRETPAS